MSETERAHRTRKQIAAACMLVAPALLLVSAIIHPEMDTDAATQLGLIADSLDAWYVAQLLALGAIVLGVPAVLGFMHMLRERRVLFGHVGGGLALLGLLAITGAVTIQLAAWQMAQPGADQAQMAALLGRVNETTGMWIPFFLVAFAFYAGLVILATGLALARAVNPLLAACIAIGAVLLAIGYLAASEVLAIAGAAVLWLGVGAIGWMVLGETEDEWQHIRRSAASAPPARTSPDRCTNVSAPAGAGALR
jgi:hypothetical protein